jgi:hypothetical protein
MASTVTATLAAFDCRAESGMLEKGQLADKSPRLSRATLGEGRATALFVRLHRLEDEADLS